MSNPDRRPCHNKDFLRYNNIINGADWHNVPGSKKECVFKRKINESIFFKLYITHDIIFSSEKPYKKKKENSFSTWKRNSPNMFFSWKNKVSKCFHNTHLIKFSCLNSFFFYTQLRSPSEQNSLQFHMTIFFLLDFIFFYLWCHIQCFLKNLDIFPHMPFYLLIFIYMKILLRKMSIYFHKSYVP